MQGNPGTDGIPGAKGSAVSLAFLPFLYFKVPPSHLTFSYLDMQVIFFLQLQSYFAASNNICILYRTFTVISYWIWPISSEWCWAFYSSFKSWDEILLIQWSVSWLTSDLSPSLFYRVLLASLVLLVSLDLVGLPGLREPLDLLVQREHLYVLSESFITHRTPPSLELYYF